MKKYIMSEKEYSSLDKVLWKSGLSKHGGLCITQIDNTDCFQDFENDKILTFKDGLQLVEESLANDICFENGSITKEEHEIVNQLFKKFEIGE